MTAPRAEGSGGGVEIRATRTCGGCRVSGATRWKADEVDVSATAECSSAPAFGRHRTAYAPRVHSCVTPPCGSSCRSQPTIRIPTYADEGMRSEAEPG
jgi:hypothetical protein